MPTTDWTSTRTQLDEIDAILKRMLNMSELTPVPPTGPTGFSGSVTPAPVPVEHVPSWVSGMAPSVPSPYPAPLPEPSPMPYVPQANPQTQNPFFQPQPVPMPYAPAPQVNPYTGYAGQPLQILPQTPIWADPVQQPQMQPPTAAIVYESTPQYAEAIPTEATAKPLFSQPKTLDRPPTPTWLMPFVIVNKIFDVLFFLMGPFGAGLRTPSGKNFLGWLGLLMLLGAIGWVVGEWYGVKWPW